MNVLVELPCAPDRLDTVAHGLREAGYCVDQTDDRLWISNTAETYRHWAMLIWNILGEFVYLRIGYCPLGYEDLPIHTCDEMDYISLLPF
jgi:hypothetical protein